MVKILSLIFLTVACAPLTATQGGSVTVISSPFTFSDEGSALGEAFKFCGSDKKPVRTAYSPGLWFYDEATYVCMPKDSK